MLCDLKSVKNPILGWFSLGAIVCAQDSLILGGHPREMFPVIIWIYYMGHICVRFNRERGIVVSLLSSTDGWRCEFFFVRR
jgi:hypothetical protein